MRSTILDTLKKNVEKGHKGLDNMFFEWKLVIYSYRRTFLYTLIVTVSSILSELITYWTALMMYWVFRTQSGAKTAGWFCFIKIKILLLRLKRPNIV